MEGRGRRGKDSCIGVTAQVNLLNSRNTVAVIAADQIHYYKAEMIEANPALGGMADK